MCFCFASFSAILQGLEPEDASTRAKPLAATPRKRQIVAACKERKQRVQTRDETAYQGVFIIWAVHKGSLLLAADEAEHLRAAAPAEARLLRVVHALVRVSMGMMTDLKGAPMTWWGITLRSKGPAVHQRPPPDPHDHPLFAGLVNGLDP